MEKDIKKLPHFFSGLKGKGIGAGVILILFLFILMVLYLFLPKATISVYVEPRVLEKDTQVIADPKVKSIDESSKTIPGEIIEVSVSGNDKAPSSGKKTIGDPAKGTIIIYNATTSRVTLKSGTALTADNGLKFTLDGNVDIASKSASAASSSSQSSPVSAIAATVGPDSNISSDTELRVASFGKGEVVAKSSGNFSGGTSKEVSVVTDSDQQKLLAILASTLRKQAQQELQIKVGAKKILQEALSEETVKKTFSKNVNDAASEFTLNMTIKYKGTVYSDEDLKTIVSKLVNTDIPSDFILNLSDTETQADVSKLEKDGRLIFLARFKAKLFPKLDTEKIKKDSRGKTPEQVADILKTYENVLGSDIKITPALPFPLQRLPFLEHNITVDVGLK